MTPPEKTIRYRDDLLERILDTVVSIDRNVEDILDRVSDHFGDLRYKTTWEDTGVGDNHDFE